MTNLIRKAVETLPGHWHQGSYTRGDNHCVVGHIMEAAKQANEVVDVDAVVPAWVFLDELTIEFTNGQFKRVTAFNDHESTTEADVLALLEKAAIKWDEQEGLV